MAMETAKDQLEVVGAMKQAAVALKGEVKKIDLDSIEDTMDDMTDLMDELGEINEIMASSYGGLEDVDEADLEAELEGLGFDDELDIGLGDAEPAIPSYLQTAPEANLASEEPAAVPAGATGVDEYGLPTAPGWGNALLPSVVTKKKRRTNFCLRTFGRRTVNAQSHGIGVAFTQGFEFLALITSCIWTGISVAIVILFVGVRRRLQLLYCPLEHYTVQHLALR